MGSEDPIVSVNWVVEEPTTTEFMTIVEAAGGTVDDAPVPYQPAPDDLDDYADAQFEPLLVVGVSVGLGFLIKRISDVWLDAKRGGGQIVDARGESVIVRPAPNLQRGTLVLLSEQGPNVYETQQKDEALEALSSILRQGGSPSDQP